MALVVMAQEVAGQNGRKINEDPGVRVLKETKSDCTRMAKKTRNRNQKNLQQM